METNYHELPESDVIINYIERRFRQGLNSNVFVIGLSGTGKSSTSIRLGELVKENRALTKKREVQIFIVDSLLKLLKAIKKCKEGDIIIIEEISILFPSRRAMSNENLAAGKIFDTIRKKNLCVILNAPIWGSMDSHIRALGHILIETLSINKKQSVVISKPHRLQTNPKSGKTYFHKFERNDDEVDRTYTKMPSMDVWNAYELNKDTFINNLHDELILKEEKRANKLNKELGNTISAPIIELTKRELEVHHLVNIERLTQSQTALRLGVDASRISRIMANIKKKTVNPKENRLNDITNPI